MSTTTIKTVPAKLGTVLTEEEFNSLYKMIHSSDKDNHTMAQQILNQCDIQKSIYWIWKLSKNKAHNMVYLRTKASRQFAKESDLFNMSWKDATEFALELIKKKWLTEEIYQYLKPEILEELSEINKENNFYKIYIEIKEEYKDYDPNSVLTHLI